MSRLKPTVDSSLKLKATHLLRALLREASYLPDAVARDYFHQYIISRFKTYQPQQNGTLIFGVEAGASYRQRSFKRRQIAIVNQRTRPLLRKGLKGLNYLRRANQGELQCLQKVLYFAYGRVGKRKYALLQELLKPDFMTDSNIGPVSHPDDLTPLQKLYYSNKQYLKYFDAPKVSSKTHYTINISDRYLRLRTVIQSQHRKGIALQRELKESAMKTPINNTWEKPMPIKRARNNVRRWYATTMTRLLPPLPTEEWDNMYAMMVGDKSISLKRRREASSRHAPTFVDEEAQSQHSILQRLAMDKPSKADKPAGMHRPHHIDSRFMRRLYGKVLALCCKLDYDEERKKWIVIWGDSRTPTPPTRPIDNFLFAGVDEKGHTPKAPKEPSTKADPSIQPQIAKGNYTHFPFYADYLPDDHPTRRKLEQWKKGRAGVVSKSH